MIKRHQILDLKIHESEFRHEELVELRKCPG
jgi:hypothetical protein